MPSWGWFLVGFVAGEGVLVLVLFALQRVVFTPRRVLIVDDREAENVGEALRTES